MNAPAPATPIRFWLALNATCVACGWLLSAAGLLVPVAWAVVLGLFVAGAALAWGRGMFRTAPWAALRRRFGRPAAAAFAVLGIAALAGGLIHAPNNIDGLAYRTPRVLHWLAEHQWHWIHAPYQRLNTRACGFEWVTAPILSLANSDRPIFLLNLVDFALLPGLVFASLRRLGVGGRAAATWMWLFPGGYCFALQAGSIGNDLHGATLALAAFALALRARERRDAADAAWSLLAAGLMTGAKSSNLPLLLPWLVAWWPGSAPLRCRPLLLFGVGALSAATSLLPVCAINQRFAGDWTGLKAEDAWIRPPGPVACALHNVGLMAAQNLLPPILPGARALNGRVESMLPESWKASLDGFAENGRHSYAVAGGATRPRAAARRLAPAAGESVARRGPDAADRRFRPVLRAVRHHHRGAHPRPVLRIPAPGIAAGGARGERGADALVQGRDDRRLGVGDRPGDPPADAAAVACADDPWKTGRPRRRVRTRGDGLRGLRAAVGSVRAD